jgi:hypothetical protein
LQPHSVPAGHANHDSTSLTIAFFSAQIWVKPFFLI